MTQSLQPDPVGAVACVPPRLLIVGAFPAPAPLERYIGGGLSQRLRGSGWQVLVASPKRTRLGRLADMLWVVWRERSRYDLSLVEVYSGPAFLWAEMVCYALRRLGKPFVLALHGGGLPEFSERHPARVRTLLRHAAAVTSPSGYLSEAMRGFHSAIQVVPNPIDTRLYSFRERQTLQPRLVWLRAFHEIYNPSLAPRVIAELAKTVPDVRLDMGGPDKGDGSLQRTRDLAQTLKVSDRINFLGAVPKTEVAATLNRADIFINTTNFDNTPVSVIEAMACGLCVVSTDVGGMPYLLRNGVEGLLVRRDDAEAMASAVSRLVRQAGLAQHLSHQARTMAQQFDWSVVLPLWERLLDGAGQGRDSLSTNARISPRQGETKIGLKDA